MQWCSESSDGVNGLIREVGVLTQRRERVPGRGHSLDKGPKAGSMAGRLVWLEHMLGGWDRKLGEGLWPQGRQLLSKHMGAWKGFGQRRVMVGWTLSEEAPGCPVRSLSG